MEGAVKIPKTFYEDHKWRDLPTPEAVKETKRNVWVRPDDPALPELRNDAEYYADTQGFDPSTQRTVCRSAKALLRALDGAGA